ncbi:ABC-2 type transport system ATP-binding protein [Paenibacillus endophyticus]|uniref:ABC-2 type transport system ATP-binding protein n=1 Tax=Paenibacillus endophyticus TaxID=1294268 RepID=A0A7W5C899_9BACL|nr:ABC transporter ATP-binding protein [Paenibacillus endophyticus]MBB3152549.1 ABC-2 type transport system ATP-binding protein [Paenibacillus endophyticus]
MSGFAIETNQLTKDYGDGRGCHGVTLTIREGEAFGFLGPNGAGKSTIVKMLTGLIKPTSGKAQIYGHASGTIEARRRLGYLPELFRYPDWLTGEEVLAFHAKLCELDKGAAKRRIQQLLDEVGIGSRGRDRLKGYSKGMQQRLGLACALLGDPDIVFLDEPASALDPVGRYEVRELLARLRGQGKTIFLNSHLLEDVEQLCDKVALLNNGQVLLEGKVCEVLRQQSIWRLRVNGYTPLAAERIHLMLGTAAAVSETEAGDGTVWIELELEDDEQIGLINYLLIELGMTIYEVGKTQSRLDEWFMQAVTGLEHRGERR